MATLGADLECAVRQFLGALIVSGDLGGTGAYERVRPAKDRLVKLLGERLGAVETSVELDEIADHRHVAGAILERPEQQDRVAESLGSLQGFVRPAQRLLEQMGYADCVHHRVEDAHDRCVVTGRCAMATASSARAWRRSSGLP